MEDTLGQNITHSAGKSSSWCLLRVMKHVHPWSSWFIKTFETPVTNPGYTVYIYNYQTKHGIVKADTEESIHT